MTNAYGHVKPINAHDDSIHMRDVRRREILSEKIIATVGMKVCRCRVGGAPRFAM